MLQNTHWMHNHCPNYDVKIRMNTGAKEMPESHPNLIHQDLEEHRYQGNATIKYYRPIYDTKIKIYKNTMEMPQSKSTLWRQNNKMPKS